jgi:hypothetical protein
MSRRYPQRRPGEPMEFDWKESDYWLCCCDCGLVHRIRLVVRGDRAQIRLWRDNRSTAQLRRHRKYPFRAARATESQKEVADE